MALWPLKGIGPETQGSSLRKTPSSRLGTEAWELVLSRTLQLLLEYVNREQHKHLRVLLHDEAVSYDFVQ